MPQTCVVVNCKNRSSKEFNKSFYRFPVDPDQRIKWVASVNRKNWSPSEYRRICSDRFVTSKLSTVYTTKSIAKFYLICVEKPSKEPSHPDYAPSVFLGGVSSSSGGPNSSV